MFMRNRCRMASIALDLPCGSQVTCEDTVGLLASAVEERRQICADIRPLIEAMAVRFPEPMVCGALVRLVEGSEKGRRGVLRKLGAGPCGP